MSPNLTVGYMAEQINRGRLDSVATRGWLADEAAKVCTRATASAWVQENLGAALIRLGERVQGTSRSAGSAGSAGDPALLSVR